MLDVSVFESIGANCEFGFFLSRLGNESGTAFRWTDIPSCDSLIAVLNRDLEGMFLYENIQPFNAGMLLDTATGFGWHSRIRSKLIDETKPHNPQNFEFITPENERHRLWKEQLGKVEYMVSKTMTSLKTGDKIFVFKPVTNDTAFDLLKARELFAAIKRHGANRLLVVTASKNNKDVGSVNELEPGLLHGVIDRFAPGSNTRDLSFDAWMMLCEKAQALIGSDFAKAS
jgi:hypothetical protein